MIFGYARLSTYGQTLEAQVAALTAAGAERIFREKVSGANAERRELRKALASIAAGDVLLVTRLDLGVSKSTIARILAEDATT